MKKEIISIHISPTISHLVDQDSVQFTPAKPENEDSNCFGTVMNIPIYIDGDLADNLLLFKHADGTGMTLTYKEFLNGFMASTLAETKKKN